MNKSKINLFKYEEKDKIQNYFLLNSSCNESTSDNKKVQQVNFEKCKKASILLDNFNVLTQAPFKDTKKYCQKDTLNDFILHNYANRRYEHSLVDSNFTNCENFFDLTKFQIKEKNYGSRTNENTLNDNYQDVYDDTYIDYNNKYKEEEESCYQEIISDTSRNAKQYNGSDTDYNEIYMDDYQNANTNCYEEFTKYKEKKEKDLIKNKRNNCSTATNKVDIDNKNNNNTDKRKFLKENKIKIKKKSAIQADYEKILKDKVANHEEEKEKIKKNFEEKLEELIKNYEKENEKKKKLISNIYNKYINIKEALIKENKEKKILKDENERLKEELKSPKNYCLENNILSNYKEKLEQYIFLSKNKDVKIKNLEEELKETKKRLTEKEERSNVISEEKKNLHRMNMLLKKDTINLQKRLETLKNMKEEMKEILFYKDLKINYFINILNVIDETIMSESESQNQRQEQQKKKKKKENGKIELDAIKNINKKIIIKSILHKIKELNKKIKKYDNIFTKVQKQGENFLYKKDEVICKNNHNDKKKENEKELFDNYFNSQNFILDEDEQILIKENETTETFFTNYQLYNTRNILKNELNEKIELQNRENSNEEINNNSQINNINKISNNEKVYNINHSDK